MSAKPTGGAPTGGAGALILLAALSLVLVGCMGSNEEPQGLASSQRTGGPRVVFDLDARPLPEIPFPNDLATRLDETSPTGRRLNISLHAPTAAEQRIRGLADELDGFGTYGALTVRFDAPIDTVDLWNRQNDLDPANDAIVLVDVDPDSPGFGERIALDVGGGRFPLVLPSPSGYFDNDRHAGESNLLYETFDEDTNRDGVLQPEEDRDGDGHLDRPNVFPGGTDTVDDLMTFYEVETDTLSVRPVRPLREATTYAVVLTKRITAFDPDPDDGVAPAPIESPFGHVHHTRQREALAPLAEILPQHGLSVDDVAFTWSFTTQSVTTALTTVRRGLYGQGSMAWLADTYAPDISGVFNWRGPKSKSNRHLLRSEELAVVLELLLPLAFGDDVSDDQVNAVRDGFYAIDYLVSGTFQTPYFLTDRDGLASPGNPNDHDEVWDVDPVTGEAVHAPAAVTWICSIPRKELNQNPGEPFPVVLYGHGYSSMRVEMLGFAGIQARRGLAVCAIDAVGHGLAIPEDIKNNDLVLSLLDVYDLGNALNVFESGRARDLDNDGTPDPGGDFFGLDVFHTRDMLRQSVVDTMMLIRILRSFDGQRRWNLIDSEGWVALDGIAGDFDGDGQVDLGGLDNDYFTWGTSLGGIVSSITAIVEPVIVAAAPTVGGAGLLDIGLRTSLGGVRRPLWLSILGPLLITRSVGEDGQRELQWLAPSAADDARVPIALLGADELLPGHTVRLTNLATDESESRPVFDDRQVRMSVAADAVTGPEKRAELGLDGLTDPYVFQGREVVERGWGDPFRIELIDADGRIYRTIETFQTADFEDREAEYQGTVYADGSVLVAPSTGFGYERQSADLRRFLGIAQTLVEPADPANYAARILDPFDYSDIEPGADPIRRVLYVSTLGDTAVPVATQIALARSAGYLGTDEVDPRYGRTVDQLLIDNHAIEGLARLERFGPEVGVNLYDPDDLDRDRDEYAAPSPATPLRATVELPDGSVGGFRMAYIDNDGEHGFFVQSPQKPFDIDTFMATQIAHYFATRGRELRDDLCFEDASCDFIPPLPGPREENLP